MTELKSEIFRIPASVYLKVEARDFLYRYGWCFAIPVIAACMAGYFDIRFVFVALMLVFVVIPPVVAIVYFHRLLSPEARYAIAWKSVERTESGDLRVRFFERVDEDSEAVFRMVSETTIAKAEIKSEEISGNRCTVRIKGRELPLIYPV